MSTTVLFFERTCCWSALWFEWTEVAETGGKTAVIDLTWLCIGTAVDGTVFVFIVWYYELLSSSPPPLCYICIVASVGSVWFFRKSSRSILPVALLPLTFFLIMRMPFAAGAELTPPVERSRFELLLLCVRLFRQILLALLPFCGKR